MKKTEDIEEGISRESTSREMKRSTLGSAAAQKRQNIDCVPCLAMSIEDELGAILAQRKKKKRSRQEAEVEEEEAGPAREEEEDELGVAKKPLHELGVPKKAKK